MATKTIAQHDNEREETGFDGELEARALLLEHGD